jgi:alpha-beta hydrolase superfamily lysophospholipase
MTWLAVLVPDLGEPVDRVAALINGTQTATTPTDGPHSRHVGFEWPDSVADFESVVDDLAATVTKAAAERSAHPAAPDGAVPDGAVPVRVVPVRVVPVRVVPVGHGLGGMIAVRYAQRYPALVAALVLAAPVLGPWQALDLLSEQDIPADSPYRLLDRATLRAVDECLTTIDFDHPLGDDLPALWLHGDDDPLVPISDTRAGMDRIRGLRFEERIYPGVGHELPSDAARDIAEFTERI